MCRCMLGKRAAAVVCWSWLLLRLSAELELVLACPCRNCIPPACTPGWRLLKRQKPVHSLPLQKLPAACLRPWAVSAGSWGGWAEIGGTWEEAGHPAAAHPGKAAYAGYWRGRGGCQSCRNACAHLSRQVYGCTQIKARPDKEGKRERGEGRRGGIMPSKNIAQKDGDRTRVAQPS